MLRRRWLTGRSRISRVPATRRGGTHEAPFPSRRASLLSDPSVLPGTSPLLTRRGKPLRRNPPIRADTVFAMLSAETDRFAQLETSIKAAKAQAAHKRRIAELTGSAWDAHESLKLKTLREQAAIVALEDSKIATKKAKTHEMELLQELNVEKNRLLAHEAAQAATTDK